MNKKQLFTDLGIFATVLATASYLLALVVGFASQSWTIFFIGTGIGILNTIIAIVLHAKSVVSE